MKLLRRLRRLPAELWHRWCVFYYDTALTELERQGRHSSTDWCEAFWAKEAHIHSLETLLKN